MWAVITGDFHNGPLSVLLTFGIWGVIAFVWLHLAGLRALIRNYRYGDPELRTVNTFMLTAYFVQMVMFWFVFGSMYSETIIFVSFLGFSVAVNGGVAHARVEAQAALSLRGERDRPAMLTPVAPAGVGANLRGRET